MFGGFLKHLFGGWTGLTIENEYQIEFLSMKDV